MVDWNSIALEYIIAFGVIAFLQLLTLLIIGLKREIKGPDVDFVSPELENITFRGNVRSLIIKYLMQNKGTLATNVKFDIKGYLYVEREEFESEEITETVYFETGLNKYMISHLNFVNLRGRPKYAIIDISARWYDEKGQEKQNDWKFKLRIDPSMYKQADFTSEIKQ